MHIITWHNSWQSLIISFSFTPILNSVILCIMYQTFLLCIPLSHSRTSGPQDFCLDYDNGPTIAQLISCPIVVVPVKLPPSTVPGTMEKPKTMVMVVAGKMPQWLRALAWRGPWFSSQHSHGDLQSSMALVPGYMASFSSLCWQQAHACSAYTYMWATIIQADS